jgi:glycogen debranching enzyme
VTPRIGKPVEVQALWINALRAGAAFDPAWAGPAELAARSFPLRFWNESAGCLFDVVDVDFAPGANDASVRPNQIFAIGGLPSPVISGAQAASVLRVVESELLTPLGLRSLSPHHPDYRPRYEGGVRERDGAYHQGTVWPWLACAFVEAWLRVHGRGEQALAEARERFLAPLLAHGLQAGLGHVSEIADAEAPHTPRGCPFQAWSVGEVLRMTGILSPNPS